MGGGFPRARMLGWIVVLFLVMPFLELYLLVQIGQRIGFWPTFAIVLGTGLLGGILARWQGAAAWREVIGALREGRAPGRELAAGALFLVGAALLLTPGVITDAFGFAMMVPVARRALAGYLIARVKASDRVTAHVGGFGTLGGSAGPPGGGPQGADLETTGYTKDPEDDEDPSGEVEP